MRAVLIGSSGLVLGREYALDAPVVTIGRRDENTIVIKDPTVSRRHAEIHREGESFSIVDKGSTSGITVNGQLVSGQHPLRDGDRIGIGSSAVFLIQLQPAEDQTIAFSQHQFADSGKTQFITRELGDPRAVPGGPSAPTPATPEPYRPNETVIQNAPASSPPPVAPPRAAPDFAPPRPSVDLGGSPLAPPTKPEMPRARPGVSPSPGMSQPPAPPSPDLGPRFDAPPPPGGNYPPMSAVSEFAPNAPGNPHIPPPGGAPQFGAPPAFSQPPAPVNVPAPMMAPPPPPPAAPSRGGRVGLVIALVVVIILVLIAAVVVGLLLTGRLG